MDISITTTKEFRKAVRLLGPKLAEKAVIKGANTAGSRVRRDLHGKVLKNLVDAPKAAFSVKGKAAHPSQKDPAYRIRMASAIPISRVSAKARKFRPLKRGSKVGVLSIKVGNKTLHFMAAQRFGTGSRAFQLLKAGPLPERAVGGVKVSKKMLMRSREFRKLVDEAQREGVTAAEKALIEALK